MKVSTLLLTYNEEINLPSVLRSLEWCDDIVVVDSGSSDNTVEIAKAAGARVLLRKFDNFAQQRNWGLENGNFRHEWVLHLDADELVTDTFVQKLDALQPNENIDAYNIPSKLIFLGRWIRHAGMYPTYQVRLGHRDRLRFIQVGHGQREDVSPSRVGTFDEPYLHYSFSHGMGRWLTKHIQYAKDEAQLVLEYRMNGAARSGTGSTEKRRAAKIRAARIPAVLRPFARFLYIYVFRQGFRDGRGGLAYALMLSVYEGMTALFIYETLLGDSTIGKLREHKVEAP